MPFLGSHNLVLPSEYPIPPLEEPFDWTMGHRMVRLALRRTSIWTCGMWAPESILVEASSKQLAMRVWGLGTKPGWG